MATDSSSSCEPALAAVRESGDAQTRSRARAAPRTPARRRARPRASSRARSRSPSRSSARAAPDARVQVADVPHLRAPDLGAEHRGAGLEVGERLRRPALGEPQPSPSSRDQHRADARRPAVLGKQREQRLRLVELAGLDRDVGQHGRGEREPRREVALLQHAQRDSRGRVRLRQRAEAQLEQAERAVGGDQAARAAGAVDLGDHRLQRASSTASKRSAVTRLHSSAARVSQFSARAAARASAASSGAAASSAGRPASTIAMPCATASASAALPVSGREERRSSTGATRDARSGRRGARRPRARPRAGPRAPRRPRRAPRSARSMTSTASTHRNSAAYASATSSAISARAPRIGGEPQRLLQLQRTPVSRPALASARAASRRTPTRSARGGGSASARPAGRPRPAGRRCPSPLAPPPASRASTQRSPAGRTPTRCAATCPAGAPSRVEQTGGASDAPRRARRRPATPRPHRGPPGG